MNGVAAMAVMLCCQPTYLLSVTWRACLDSTEKARISFNNSKLPHITARILKDYKN